MSKVGTRVTSIDAIEKVTGNLKYGSDFQLPGMLYGKILRSPIPHAKICSIDASQAQKLSGVKAIATGWDYDLPLFSVAGVKNVDDRLLAKKRFVISETR